MERTMKVRLVLLPNKKLSKLSEELSKQIGTLESTYFKLDSTHIPHVTITTISFNDEKELIEVNRLAKELGSKLYQKELEISGIEHDGLGFLSIHFTNDQLISELHNQANEIFGKKYTVKTEKFVPHLTLTRMKKEDEVGEVIKQFTIKQDTYRLSYLAICESGEHGTCTKILKKIRLKGGMSK